VTDVHRTRVVLTRAILSGLGDLSSSSASALIFGPVAAPLLIM